MGPGTDVALIEVFDPPADRHGCKHEAIQLEDEFPFRRGFVVKVATDQQRTLGRLCIAHSRIPYPRDKLLPLALGGLRHRLDLTCRHDITRQA
jgi:hypothetical protein